MRPEEQKEVKEPEKEEKSPNKSEDKKEVEEPRKKRKFGLKLQEGGVISVMLDGVCKLDLDIAN